MLSFCTATMKSIIIEQVARITRAFIRSDVILTVLITLIDSCSTLINIYELNTHISMTSCVHMYQLCFVGGVIITCACEAIIIQFIPIVAEAVMGSLGVVAHLLTALSSIATFIDVCTHGQKMISHTYRLLRARLE